MNTTIQSCKTQAFDIQDSRPLVLFIGRSGGRLMDNVKYMFIEAATHDYGFAPCFLTTHRDEYSLLSAANLPVLLVGHCPQDFFTKAKLAILDDFTDKCGPQLHAGLRTIPKIQLWHGIPLKKIGFPEIASQVNMNNMKKLHLASQYSGYFCAASTSAWATEELFSKVFKAQNIEALGYPRNDVLLRPINAFDMINTDQQLFAQCQKHIKNGGKIAIYMPTFRDTGGDFLSDEALDLGLLATLCQQNNILLVAKFHPYVAAEAFRDLPGFVLCKSSADMYPILPLAHTLITDYSSIYFDWLLLDKPMLFFAYDKEKYISQDRELFFEYESFTPGLVSQNQEQFLRDFMLTLVQEKDFFKPARQVLRKKLFDNQDAQASARWCLYVKEWLEQ